MVSIANTTTYGPNDTTLLAACPASPLPTVSVVKAPTTPVPCLPSALSPRRSPIVQVKIRSDDDDEMKYQEIRITGVIYCDLDTEYCNVATSIEDEEQQIAIVSDSEFGFLRAAGVVYPCDEDDVDAMSLRSSDAMLDPSDLLDLDDFDDDARVPQLLCRSLRPLSICESPKGVMDFEEASASVDFKADLFTSHNEEFIESWLGFQIPVMLNFCSSSACLLPSDLSV